MSHRIAPSDLQLLQREAEVAARRLVRRFRLPSADLADLCQDLLLDLITRLKRFDPGRGTLGAFAGTVTAHRATRIANKLQAQRRLFGCRPISLDETLPGTDGETLGETIPEAAGYAALCGQPTDAFVGVERRIDVERGLGILDARERELCAALSRVTVEQLAAAGQGARSSLYRRVKDVRLALTAAGLRAAA
jgi:RNA polymerase sigma factor (sigma-70 family)